MHRYCPPSGVSTTHCYVTVLHNGSDHSEWSRLRTLRPIPNLMAAFDSAAILAICKVRAPRTLLMGVDEFDREQNGPADDFQALLRDFIHGIGVAVVNLAHGVEARRHSTVFGVD